MGWPAQTDWCRAAADRIARTLHEVHGAADPSALYYRAWNDDTGALLDWPVFATLNRDPLK